MAAPSLSGFAPNVTYAENLVSTLRISGLLAEDRIAVRNHGTGFGQIGTGGVADNFIVTFNAVATSAAVDALGENLIYGDVSDIAPAAGGHVPGFGRFTASSPVNKLTYGASDNAIRATFKTVTFADVDGDGDSEPVVGQGLSARHLFFQNGGAFGRKIDIHVTADDVNTAPALSGLGGTSTVFAQGSPNYGREGFLTSEVTADDATFSAPTTLTSFAVLLADDAVNNNGVLDSFSGTLSWGIYSDDGGGVGTLLYSGTAAALQLTDSGVQDNFGCDVIAVSASFGASVSLVAGTYWFALHEGVWGSASDGTELYWISATTVTGAAGQFHYVGDEDWSSQFDQVFNLVASGVTFAENTVNATPQLLDSDVTFSDAEGNFNGGTLTVTGLLAEDRIAIRNAGTGGGQIGVSGSDVTYGGVTIGSFTGGTGSAFAVTFNASASTAAIDAVIENLTYANVSNTPTASRTLSLNVTDAGGATLEGGGSPLTVYVVAEAEANTAPTVSQNIGMSVYEGLIGTITAARLDFNDAEQADGAIVYTVTSVATNGTLRLNGTALGLNDTFTQSDINNGLVSYFHDGSETTSASFGFSVSDGAGGSVTGQTFTFTVDALDDASVAVIDNNSETGENATVNIDVRANDTDVDSAVEAVAQIAGQAAAVGVAITLASGATVTLQGDGTLTYNPNGRFAYLISDASATATGASNTSAQDSFVYTLAGGDTAVVKVTVNGVDGAGDQYWGSGIDNDLTGTGSADLFNLSQGGEDTVEGGSGNDGFLFGATFGSGDHVDGGAGTLDQIGLQGDYSGGLTLAADSITGVEMFVLMAGDDNRFGGATGTPLSYSITTHDDNVGPGDTLYFQANSLRPGESFTLNASDESDGTIFVYGGFGTDNLTGGQSTDAFYFGSNRFGSNDRVDGLSGTNDTLGLQGYYSTASGGSDLAFGANQIFNIDILALLTSGDARFGGGGPGPYGYNITMDDANVAVGERLVVNANTLASDEIVNFNGSDESNGFFTVYAGAAADTIVGGQLGDRIYGRGGGDTMSGGGGNDVFVYMAASDSTSAAFDTITDFQTGDIVDLQAIDANSTTDGNQTFTFFGTTVTTTAGSLYYVDNGDGTYTVFGHTDDDGTADFELHITEPGPVVEGDFIL